MKPFKKISHLLEYAALKTAGGILLVLPLGATYLTARFLGWCAFSVLKIRRGVTMENLTAALGDTYTDAELLKIARESYQQIAITFAEILVFPRLKDRIPQIVDLSQFPLIRDTYAKGKGIILVTAHYGSWEIAGAAVTAGGIPITAVGKTQANRKVDRFLNSRRDLMGIGVTAKDAPSKIVRALRNGETIALVSDQDAGRQGIMSPFFGRPASTPTGAAQLALRYGSPLLVMAAERVADGRYRYVCRDLPVREGDTVESITARMNGIIEDIVRTHPEQYFWMHRRWKTRAIPGKQETKVRSQESGVGSQEPEI